ncbi:MAG: hypothetical protein IKC63_00645 [Clostridia bacterium]|nr:hypothetical protein [Clostridia bacterium]
MMHGSLPWFVSRKDIPLPDPRKVDPQSISDALRKERKGYVVFFALTVAMVILVFALLAVFVPIIGSEKEFSDFTERDVRVFILYLAITLVLFAAMFVFAILARKSYYKAERSRAILDLIACYHRRFEELTVAAHGVLRLFFAFSQGLCVRALIYEEEGNTYTYALQSFFGIWATFTREGGFSSPEDAAAALFEDSTVEWEEERP